MKRITTVLSCLLLPLLAFADETDNKHVLPSLQPQTGCPCYLLTEDEVSTQLTSVGLTPVGPDDPIDFLDPRQRIDPIDPIKPIDPCLRYPEAASEPVLADIEVNVDPIYIGGVMYRLTKADFLPTHRLDYLYSPCSLPEPVWVLTGYVAKIPVTGDAGQELNFEISGRSGTTDMELEAICGDFRESDSGNKYFISKTMSTNQTCQRMHLAFTFADEIGLPVFNSGPASIELNVIITESF